MSELSRLIRYLKTSRLGCGPCSLSEDVLLITRLGCRYILNIICFALGFHIIFVCKIDVCPEIVLYSIVFSFDPSIMPIGPVILISASTYKQWI